MQRLDRLGLRDDQDLVASFEGGATEVVGVQILELEVRAGRAVVDEDAFVQRVQVGVVRVRTSERADAQRTPLLASGYPYTVKSLRLRREDLHA